MNITPGFTWTPATPITAANLNLTAQPIGTIGTNEVTLANLPAQSTNNILLGRATTGAGNIEQIDLTTTGLGYYIGAGGAVTQGTSRTTTVILPKLSGAITLFTTAGSATPATFTVTNSLVAATDVIILNQKSGADKYELFVTNVIAGAFSVTFFTTGGTTSEVVVLSFAVLKGEIS